MEQHRLHVRQIVVVIPVYNCVDFLEDAVSSVRNQPYGQLNIVLVNDGSTDGSAALCDNLAENDERITVIHKENGGVSSARNMAIEYILEHYCDGYIAFLDADDFWCANAITDRVLAAIQQEHNTDIFAFGGLRTDPEMSSFSTPYTYTEQILSGGNSAIWSLKGQFCANLYSVELLRKWNIRFNRKLKYSEDVIFRLQCSFLSREIHFLPNMLYCYKENPSSAMSKVLSIKPVDYYIPIINGWIESDAFLNAYAEETKSKCNAGYILAGIYFTEMAADHYKRGFGRKDLQRVLDKHPNYDAFLNMRPKDVSVKQYKNHMLMIQHPFLFQMKYRVLGTTERIIRAFLATKPGRRIRNKWRYPLSSIPENR